MRGFVLGVIGSRGRGLGRFGERGLNLLGEGGNEGLRRIRWLGGGGEVDAIGGGGGPRRTLWLGRGGGVDGIGKEKAALRFRGSCELLPNLLTIIVPLSDLYELKPLVRASLR